MNNNDQRQNLYKNQCFKCRRWVVVKNGQPFQCICQQDPTVNPSCETCGGPHLTEFCDRAERLRVRALNRLLAAQEQEENRTTSSRGLVHKGIDKWI